MSVSKQDVEKVALLARLSLSDAEVEKMTPQLAAIVEYVDHLGEVDTDGVEPMAHAIELQNVFRDDIVAPSLTRADALSNAPHHNDEGYLAPAVLGD